MNIVMCHLMGLALGPQLPPLDTKSVTAIIIKHTQTVECQAAATNLGNHRGQLRQAAWRGTISCESLLSQMERRPCIPGASDTLRTGGAGRTASTPVGCLSLSTPAEVRWNS